MAVAEGFEPSVGGYPTHAFEACSLGRSDTPPQVTLPDGRSESEIGWSGALSAEEGVQHGRAFGLEYTPANFGTMVEATVTHHIPQRADRTGLGFPRAEDHAANPGQDQGPGTHRAGFQRHGQRCALQPPTVTVYPCRAAQRQDLGMRGGVSERLSRIAGTSQLPTVRVEDDRADRDVSRIGLRRRGEGGPDEVLVCAR